MITYVHLLMNINNKKPTEGCRTLVVFPINDSARVQLYVNYANSLSIRGGSLSSKIVIFIMFICDTNHFNCSEKMYIFE